MKKFDNEQTIGLLQAIGGACSVEEITEYVMDNTDQAPIPNCPFCGHAGLIGNSNYVICSNLECSMHHRGIPLAVWTRRPSEKQTETD